MVHAKFQNLQIGEIGLQIEENIRGTDLFIVQSTSTPVNDNLMEMLLLVDAARRASAKSITCVIPYYGYARQDRKNKPRVPISAALVAELLESAGATLFVLSLQMLVVWNVQFNSEKHWLI
jgi:ribose-phosphate pyrophosphokinase